MITSSEESGNNPLNDMFDGYLSGEKKLLDLSAAFSGTIGTACYKLFGASLERALSIKEMNTCYRDFLIKNFSSNENFFDLVLAELACSYVVSDEDVQKIPKEGPVIIVSNHPYGGLDGVILGAILSKARPDFKFLANYLLGCVPQIAPYLIGVDPFDNSRSTRANINPLRETISILNQGGCVATFPAGEVSHFQLKTGGVSDREWSKNIARIAQRTNAKIIPVFFNGRNSNLFQIAGMCSAYLRTGMLVREFLNKRNQTIFLKVGSPISPQKIQEFSSADKLTNFLRLNTYLLKNKQAASVSLDVSALANKSNKKARPMVELEVPVDELSVREEVEQLPSESIYYEKGKFAVYVVRAEQIPKALQQIGYLRERTFREVGEGTGKAIDLDSFDDHYWHMFLWDRDESQIAGSYRLCEIEETLAQYGKKGLYTYTLFKYDDEFLKRLSPGIEMGRSFIVPEYQRKHASLSILWKGVGAFLAKRPWCVNLFGPVSISQDYQRISRNLMVQFFRNNNVDNELTKMVHPRKAIKANAGLKSFERKALRESVPSVEHVSALISELETDSKGLPTLLRHYLKLNGKLISFNVDKEFSDVLDGLILVNLKNIDSSLLGRVFSNQDMKVFLRYHNDDACV